MKGVLQIGKWEHVSQQEVLKGEAEINEVKLVVRSSREYDLNDHNASRRYGLKPGECAILFAQGNLYHLSGRSPARTAEEATYPPRKI